MQLYHIFNKAIILTSVIISSATKFYLLVGYNLIECFAEQNRDLPGSFLTVKSIKCYANMMLTPSSGCQLHLFSQLRMLHFDGWGQQLDDCNLKAICSLQNLRSHPFPFQFKTQPSSLGDLWCKGTRRIGLLYLPMSWPIASSRQSIFAHVCNWGCTYEVQTLLRDCILLALMMKGFERIGHISQALYSEAIPVHMEFLYGLSCSKRAQELAVRLLHIKACMFHLFLPC